MRGRIAFRVDASTMIGTGHVIRCLTLADTLARGGCECLFISRGQEGSLIDLVRGHGHRVHELSPSRGDAYGQHPMPPVHAGWLGGAWKDDAAECGKALSEFVPDWLVVDHYAIDATWESAVLTENMQLLVIDDLADRDHRADVLLDQNFGRCASNYDGLVPDSCERLIGVRYALIRPEFARMRSDALRRRSHPLPRRLIVTLGGADRENISSQILSILADMRLPDGVSVDVVVGASSPWRETLLAEADTMPFRTRILISPDMARAFAEADVCIGAAGGTAWERCVLGLPTILLALADNQVPGMRALVDAGICAGVHDGVISRQSRFLEQSLPIRLAQLLEHPGLLAAFSERSADLTDGSGASLVTGRLWQ